MPSLTEYFTLIIKKQKELNYNFPNIVRPPASLTAIHDTEKQLNIQFNKELIDLYSLADGTNISGESTSGEIGLIPIHAFLNLSDAIGYYKASIKSEDHFYNWYSDFKPGDKLFPFLEDGAGNCYWIDLNENTPNYSKVYWTNTFGDTPDYKFNSLTNFFQVIYECYESGIFEVDADGYLDCDYTRWGELAKKYNPELKYWDRYLAS